MKEGKSAVLAVILSILWPSIGHLYLGSIGKGVTFLLLALGGWGLFSTLIGAIFGIPILIVVYIWAPIDVYKAAAPVVTTPKLWRKFWIFYFD